MLVVVCRDRSELAARGFLPVYRDITANGYRTLPKLCKALETMPCMMAHTILCVHMLQTHNTLEFLTDSWFFG